ncbi:saccharopine dehydrogenase NADP-binding domain-containing protein [candidate division KSB1 bacterium]|nr:saccharopine dehydrogenase NADP-binding domain-containing protein [candidate division KSB1 bacterium]
MRIIVLGNGLVGSAIAIDLAQESQFKITVVDISESALNKLNSFPAITKICIDLNRPEILKELIKDYDLVIGALPGFMGFKTMRTVIEAGKNMVDISFFPENPFELDALAKTNQVMAIVDCGVAPGCSNLFLGQVYAMLDETTSFLCYVGGLPTVREWPYEYKVVFSPYDVLEEYTRPARYIERQEMVVQPALSDAEHLFFPEVGTLEAFNSDGLRTLIDTLPIPNMKEKTLRYPGHAEKMKILRETGFFSKEIIEVDGHPIQPLQVTAKLLFPRLRLKSGEEDFTVMKIMVEGRKGGKKFRYTYDLLDRFDSKTQTTSMARTTGYTCSVMARLVLDGTYHRTGVIPMEYVGQHQSSFQKMIQGLAERNIIYRETIEEI